LACQQRTGSPLVLRGLDGGRTDGSVRGGNNYSGGVHRIAGWWDGFELWVAGLPFIPQFAVVLVGMIPVSVAIASLLDRGLRIALHLLGRDRAAQSPVARAATGHAGGPAPTGGAGGPGARRGTPREAA
jgi:hypothetical protein